PDTEVPTIKIRMAPEEESNQNVNKVVCGVDGRALYFSKYPIPYDRDRVGVARYKHPGFYAYRKSALDAFHRLPPSPLELTEKLEQLRFLENGIDIVVVETVTSTIGVDTEADLRVVEALMTGSPPPWRCSPPAGRVVRRAWGGRPGPWMRLARRCGSPPF